MSESLNDKISFPEFIDKRYDILIKYQLNKFKDEFNQRIDELESKLNNYEKLINEYKLEKSVLLNIIQCHHNIFIIDNNKINRLEKIIKSYKEHNPDVKILNV